MEKIKKRFGKLFTKSNWNLIKELTRANFKANDHNSILGVFWSLIGPLALLVVMYFVFRTRYGQEIHAYPLYLLIGIITVSFFVTATAYMLKIFITQQSFALESTVPRESIVLSSISISAYKFIIEVIFCIILSLFYGLFPWKSILLLFPILIAYIGLVLGIGMFLSIFYCFARDIEHIWMIASRLLFFATPVFYSLKGLSPVIQRLIYWYNPLTPFLSALREVIMGSRPINMLIYMHSLVFGIVFFILGYYIFILFENIAIEKA